MASTGPVIVPEATENRLTGQSVLYCERDLARQKSYKRNSQTVDHYVDLNFEKLLRSLVILRFSLKEQFTSLSHLILCLIPIKNKYI